MPDSSEIARVAAAHAAAARIEPGMTIGLGSGRAVWRVIEAIAERWPSPPPLRAAFASQATEERARAIGLAAAAVDEVSQLDLVIDGADEIDRELGLLKGGGAALLREKLLVAQAERFLVVAEASKLVERLGATRPLPVEVVRFAWPRTRERLLRLLPEAALRRTSAGEPVLTEEGHYLIDGALSPDAELEPLAAEIKATLGVVEHGLFLGMATLVLLGGAGGEVEVLERGG